MKSDNLLIEHQMTTYHKFIIIIIIIIIIFFLLLFFIIIIIIIAYPKCNRICNCKLGRFVTQHSALS